MRFHGIAVVHLGQAHYRVLRSGAMRGLRAERKGANPVLHLASGQFLADPEAWAICQTFRDAPELGGYERMEQILGLFTDSADMLPKNGPTAVLLSRIRRLGWVVGGGGLIQDSLGTFSLFDAAWDEIGVRMRLAWSHVLSVEAAHRPTFGGLDSVDVVATQQAVEHFSPADQVYLRCHLDGDVICSKRQGQVPTWRLQMFVLGVVKKMDFCIGLGFVSILSIAGVISHLPRGVLLWTCRSASLSMVGPLSLRSGVSLSVFSFRIQGSHGCHLLAYPNLQLPSGVTCFLMARVLTQKNLCCVLRLGR